MGDGDFDPMFDGDEDLDAFDDPFEPGHQIRILGPFVPDVPVVEGPRPPADALAWPPTALADQLGRVIITSHLDSSPWASQPRRRVIRVMAWVCLLPFVAAVVLDFLDDIFHFTN